MESEGAAERERVLIESECVCAECWSEMGPGSSWLRLQRPYLAVSSTPAAG